MAQAKDATGTVSVLCGLPHGIVLEITHAPPEPGKEVRKNPFLGQRYTLKGTNAVARENEHQMARPGTPFGVTEGIPEDFWNEWLSHHKDLPFVRDGQVAMVPKAHDAQVEAKARKGAKGGPAPLDPNKLPDGITKLDDKDK